MLDESDLRALISREAIDRDGHAVGYLEAIFNDRETGRPEWVGVFTGTFRHHHRLVPVQGAERDGDRLRLPWTKEQVENAPDYGKPEASISEEMEREAYAHYGVRREAAV